MATVTCKRCGYGNMTWRPVVYRDGRAGWRLYEDDGEPHERDVCARLARSGAAAKAERQAAHGARQQAELVRSRLEAEAERLSRQLGKVKP